MTDVNTDAYWTDEFEITVADLDRLAHYIRRAGQAHELTALAHRVVRGRLRHGEETSEPVPLESTQQPSVRLWDPSADWTRGDQVIVASRLSDEDSESYAPFVGEIEAIDGHRVTVRIDAVDESWIYVTKPTYGPDDLEKWRKKVEQLVKPLSASPDEDLQSRAVILKHGERAAGLLFDALRTDDRFVRLAGHWFLRELAVPATDEQLTALAWGMVDQAEPKPTADLIHLVEPPLADGDPGLFGLYLAMRQRDNLFSNADPGQRPRWELAGPPPGSFTPHHAAYDPETYEILCLPDEKASPETAHKLWDLDLLAAVM